ncbi:MAG: nucleoside-diphosphate sugar epimerase [Lentisphaerae bacterium RIFOXYB12_FULL_65_16]|nr:MAG: nucleoside-diphosphate sugar epimerase [Lentisphaerae bacterium RIFOXYA12_64_32]OGV91657.1 MAG: nucleoside-diphosphate sugar epimerase [Lentisphaerae bacterium RIFOXYB12_FULL_65_16]
MKYLITGGAGFIGSHLTEALLQAGHDVAVIDDLSTGSTENLQGVVSHPKFRFILGSVEDSHDLGALIAWADIVFHLAAAVGVDLVVNNPVHTIETNVHGTENVFRYAALTSTKVVLASTSEVYGKATSPEFRETDDLLIGPPTHYRWAYAASKALDEYLAMAYQKERRLKAIVVRLFNTVGPRQTGRYGMVLPRFVEQALRHEPLRVFGDGAQTRCFCHVHDTLRALMMLAEHPGAEGEIFNIGRTESISIDDLARRVIDLTGSRSEIVHVPYSEAYAPGFEDMRRRVPDTRKIRGLTGWVPCKTLDQIIQEVRAHIEARLEPPRPQ